MSGISSHKRNQGSPTSKSNISKVVEDCLATMRLHRVLYHQIQKQDLESSFNSEMRAVPVIAKMEYNGISFDKNELIKHKELIKRRKKQLQEQAEQLLKRKILLSSPPDVANALYSDLKLPRPKIPSWKQKSPSISTKDEEEESSKESFWEGCTKDSVLKNLSEFSPFPGIVLEYRQCKHILSNWLDSLPTKAHYPPHSDFPVLYPHWMQTGSSTGRLSCKDPNLQSIPKNTISVVSMVNT